MKNHLTAKLRVLRALRTHQNMSTRLVLARANVRNASARVAELRDEGHPIFTNSRYSKRLGKRYFYRLAEATPVKTKKAATRK